MIIFETQGSLNSCLCIFYMSVYFSGELLDGFLPIATDRSHARVICDFVTCVEKLRLTLNSVARCHLEY